MVLRDLLKNPVTEWMNWLLHKRALERKNPGLKLKYFAKAYDCRFGTQNVIKDRSLLLDSKLGDFTYIAENCILNGVTFGKFCSIGPNTRMGMGMHPVNVFVSTHPAFYSTKNQAGVSFADRDYFDEYRPITIGNDVWIGANVVVMDGIRIGDGAIVAAGSVVTFDVPPYMIVGGAPANPVRSRFSAEEVARLRSIAWWDKDEAWLRANFKAFHDIGTFLSGQG